jgi:hypothetical protein
MSDKPQGPGWWLASDGTWHPPELHPSLQAEAAEVTEAVASRAPHPAPVPELATRPTWNADNDRRPEAGPMYPDLFQQAVAGTSLANVVTVKYTDGEARPGLDVPTGGRPDSDLVMADSSRTPAEVGAFTGASAKRRWRLHR